MTYEQLDVDEKERSCCEDCLHRYNPKNDPLEFMSLISLISLTIGIILTLIGYLIPRDYKFDANRPAHDMEQTEMYYQKLAWDLDVCIIFGMGFVVLGGLILAGIIAYLHVTSDFWTTLCGVEEEDQEPPPPPPHGHANISGSSGDTYQRASDPPGNNT